MRSAKHTVPVEKFNRERPSSRQSKEDRPIGLDEKAEIVAVLLSPKTMNRWVDITAENPQG